MFKLNDKKHRKRALMKLQCAPKCTTEDEKDGNDFYNVASTSASSSSSNGHQHQVTSKTMEYAAQYNLEDAPSHLIRKTMKFEEVQRSSGSDQVDNAGISRVSKVEFSSGERNSTIKSKVLPRSHVIWLTLKFITENVNWIKDRSD